MSWFGVAMLLLGLGMLLGIVTVPRILIQRRDSNSTIAWVLALVLLPYVGVLAYWILGTRRIIRMRVMRRLAGSAFLSPLHHHSRLPGPLIAGTEPLPPGGVVESSLCVVGRIGGWGPVAGNQVNLLLTGEEKMDALERTILQATAHVHVQYYSIRPDATGRRLRDLLIARAREGIEVRLLYDDMGSLGLPRSFFEPLAEAGGKVAVFLPVNPFARRLNLPLRNHRKLVVVDGRVAFTGGMNIGDEYLRGGSRRAKWRDTHVRVEGPAVRQLQQLFMDDWGFATKERLAEASYYAETPAAGPHVVQLVTSGPDEPWDAIHLLLFAVITRASHSVWLTTPYFMPDQALEVALQTAALRGVDVKLLIPRRSDHRLLDYVARSHLGGLLRAGVRVYEYLPCPMHAKTVVVDGVWSTVGSANIDERSFRINFEANLVVYRPEFAKQLGDVILQDLELSEELQLDAFRGRPRRQRLIEGFYRMFSPLL